MGPLAPGTEFAGHRIESLVGRGGMGVVYRARHLELDRVVALKVIAPELLEDPRIRERFVLEARTAASIEHPNIVPLHYVGQEDGIAYLAMRFVDGADVRALVRQDGVLAPKRAAAIVTQAGAALDAIHAAGYVHRDVKPGNLLLAAGDHVYLTDFGLAKQVLTRSGATRSGHWVGTLDYVAPEQIRGGRVDARADVYALGGVLHFMLTAHIPFDRDSDEAKLWAHLSEPPPTPVPAAAGAARSSSTPSWPAPWRRNRMSGSRRRAISAAPRAPRPAGALATQQERMVARGAASPEGAEREPGFTDETSTVTGIGPAPPAVGEAPVRRWRRPAALGAAAAAAVGAAAVAVALIVGSPDGDKGSDRRRAAAAVSRGTSDAPGRGGRSSTSAGSPNGIAIAGSDLWVTSRVQAWLTRIDAATGRERPDHPRVGRGALDVVAGPRAVWVAVTPAGEVVRLDARTGRVTRRFHPLLRPVALAAGAARRLGGGPCSPGRRP